MTERRNFFPERLRNFSQDMPWRIRNVTSEAAMDPWELATAAVEGNREAEESLWQAFRPRLKRMIVSQLDERLSARVDPSDIVQETIIEAHRRLPDSVGEPPLPFYPWLRGIAIDHLQRAYRRHVQAQMRSVAAERPLGGALADDSVDYLAERLLHQEEGCPVKEALKDELRRRVRDTLDQLPAPDREVLLLRQIEDMTTTEAALVLGISESAVRNRHLRALERFAALLRAAGESGGGR